MTGAADRGAQRPRHAAKRWAVRILTLLGMTVYVFVFGFVIAEDAGWQPDEGVHFVGAVVMGLMLVSGMGRLILDPSDRAALWHGAAALLAVLLVEGIVGDPDNVGGQAGPYDLIYVIVAIPFVVAAVVALRIPQAPANRPLQARWLLALGLVGLALVVPYVWDQGVTQRNSWPPAADPHHNSHWASAAWSALVLPMLAIVASRRVRSWRVPALAASVGALLLGAVWALFPDDASSLGRMGGFAALLWAAAVGAVTVLHHRWTGRVRGG